LLKANDDKTAGLC